MDGATKSKAWDGIEINAENLRKYGFACFFPAGKRKDNVDFVEREIILATGHENESTAFKVPAEFCFTLAADRKLTQCPEFIIRRPADSKDIVRQLSERAGWNQTRADIEGMHQMDTGHFMTGEFMLQGQHVPLGSGVALKINEELCWIGMILVHPELRRQGIARGIMQACVNHARQNLKTPVIGLDATPGGKQVYDDLGFCDSFTIWRTLISTDGHTSPDKFVVPYETSPVEDFVKSIQYIERASLMNQLSALPGTKKAVFIKDGRVKGFIMSRPGRLYPYVGPLIAGTDEAAKALLRKVLGEWKNEGYSHVFMDIPEWHLEKQKVFVENEDCKRMDGAERIAVQKKRPFIRMYQLASGINIAHMSSIEDKTKSSFEERYDKTLSFMEKERRDILPFMYGICGPEWG
ncbi:MAG: GNAT family N-acetyltransferase [Cyclobacteriaceae bacterium]|nr:GNAT family N-acetyltransferase [Cyclobacteriaceae bacterium]